MLTLCRTPNPNLNILGRKERRLAILLSLSILLASINLEMRPPVGLGNCVSLTRSTELGSGCCTLKLSTGSSCLLAACCCSCSLFLFKKKSSRLSRRCGATWLSVWMTFPEPKGIWMEKEFWLAVESLKKINIRSNKK